MELVNLALVMIVFTSVASSDTCADLIVVVLFIVLSVYANYITPLVRPNVQRYNQNRHHVHSRQ